MGCNRRDGASKEEAQVIDTSNGETVWSSKIAKAQT